MLSQTMSDRLNKQINLEMYSSHLYLQMSSWCAYSKPQFDQVSQ
ncbi:MAG: ferritin-like domain-containing protein [Cyanobacteria bacterium P01_A01_bin.70]